MRCRRSSTGEALARKICRPCSPAPLDDEDLLEEILLRLHPQPSSFPRASLVCKRWRSILSNPQFLGRFRKHHQKPPLLGFFAQDFNTIVGFRSILDPPDRIPAERFPVPRTQSAKNSWRWVFQGCRDGLALLINHLQRVVVLWNPLTGQLHHAPFPVGFIIEQRCFSHGAMLCADAEDVHMHRDCFSSSFKFVLICSGETQTSACVYESSSGVWGNIISTTTNDSVLGMKSSILIGNIVYWLFFGGDILAFDIKRHTLGVIKKPADAHTTPCWSFQLLRTHDDRLALAIKSNLSLGLWKIKSNCDGAVEWVLLEKIVQLEGIFPQGMDSYFKEVYMVGYDEDSNVIVLATYIGDFILQLDTKRFRKISNISWNITTHYPYRNFYTIDKGIGWKWLDP